MANPLTHDERQTLMQLMQRAMGQGELLLSVARHDSPLLTFRPEGIRCTLGLVCVMTSERSVLRSLP